MPIPCQCTGCGKRFKAPDAGAGKRIPCPNCKTPIQIPKLEVEDDHYQLAPAEPSPLPKVPAVPRVSPQPQPTVAVTPPREVASPTLGNVATTSSGDAARPVSPPGWVPPTRSSVPDWLRHLHWSLALAMIPLALSIVLPEESHDQLIDRIAESLQEAGFKLPTDDTGSLEGGSAASAEPVINDQASLFEVLPGHKLKGALLARDSVVHWFFAIASAVLYMTFFVYLASDKSANPLHLLGLALFTATGGIMLLLGVQMLSGIGTFRVRGIVGLFFLLLMFIGLSYRMAIDPESSLVSSFFGYTFGVGLCEEICKALPLLVYYKMGENKQTWRGAFLWGLASGAGFGISEGIMYSHDFYNGISGIWIYIVRFISCVALHAIWAGSIGISINQRQAWLQEEHDSDDWYMYLVSVLLIIAIPMVLHGLYDTFLKKDMSLMALVTAGASFGYLAWQISQLRQSDDQDERAAYVASYIKQRASTR